MAESSNVSFLVAEEGVVNGNVSQLPRERLVSVLHREVGADLKKVRCFDCWAEGLLRNAAPLRGSGGTGQFRCLWDLRSSSYMYGK
ncbi:hypothetical protein Tco_0070282, partial [Tanacetum coccineum]